MLARCADSIARMQRHFASRIHAVGEDDERLAALLLLHQLVRGKEDGVVQRGASAAVMTA